MKKNLTLLLCLITVSIFAQLKIKGFGKLKLDSPVSIIYDMGKKIIPINSSIQYVSKVYKKYNSNDIFELKADTTQTYMLTYSSVNERVKFFVVPNYKVIEGITIEGVKLKFYNNKLIDITCEYSRSLNKALTTKYGEPKIDVKKKENIFTNSIGGKVIKKDVTYTTTWNTNATNISCSSIFMNYYNDDGEEKNLSYTHLYNWTFDEQIRKSEDSIKIAIKKRKLIRDRKKLDKF